MVKEGGLYAISCAVFGGFSPKLELLFNDEVHLEREMEGEVPRLCTGVSLYEFFILSPNTRIKIRFRCMMKRDVSLVGKGSVESSNALDPESFNPEGFIEIKKL